MKIIVIDSAKVRIEVLNVADHMLKDGIELFLSEHDYSLDIISWVATDSDSVPVLFHEYDTDKENGEEVHTTRSERLKDFSIYDSVQEIKKREQEELANTLRLYGKKIGDSYEWHFDGECPIVPAYDHFEPCDMVILSVRMDKDGSITFIGDEKNDRCNEHEIDVDDIFAGHINFITSEIGK